MPAPLLVSASPNQGPLSGGTTVTLVGSHLTGAVLVKFGTSPAASFRVVSDSTVTAVAPAGTGIVGITVTAPGGTSNAIAYQYLAAPILTGVAPVSGPMSGGNTVTMTGTHLTYTSAVKFGTVPAASFRVVSDTQVEATAPPGSPGPVGLALTTPGGTSNVLTYVYLTAPALASLAPDQGPLSGGNTVSLNGFYLTGLTAVEFGSSPAASFRVVSDTQVEATAPARAAGTVNVTVAAPGGTSGALNYTYLPPPTLTSASPDAGPQRGGTSVTLTGTELGSAEAVRFGASPATFTVVSNTVIVAYAPAGTGTVDVTVTTPGGQNSLPLPYEYVPSTVP